MRLRSTGGIAESQGYAQIGPRLFPYLIGAGLTLCGAVLAWHALAGGWRNVPLDQEGHDAPDWPAFAIDQRRHRPAHGGHRLGRVHHRVDAAVRADRARFRQPAARRAMRSSRVLLAVVVFFIFTLGLGLSLPKGPFGGA